MIFYMYFKKFHFVLQLYIIERHTYANETMSTTALRLHLFSLHHQLYY